jgi:DNA-binding transcriptional ArsR family regulator
LAKKRWIEGYSNQKLGEFFDLSPITIGQHLRRLKNSNLLDELESTENEDFQIREKWNS